MKKRRDGGAAPSVGHQHRYRRRVQHRPGRSAQDQLARAAVSVAAHDDHPGATVRGPRKQFLACVALGKAQLLVHAGSMSKTGYGQYLARLINDDVVVAMDAQRPLKGAA